jgi:hypothetical protein
MATAAGCMFQAMLPVEELSTNITTFLHLKSDCTMLLLSDIS